MLHCRPFAFPVSGSASCLEYDTASHPATFLTFGTVNQEVKVARIDLQPHNLLTEAFHGEPVLAAAGFGVCPLLLENHFQGFNLQRREIRAVHLKFITRT